MDSKPNLTIIIPEYNLPTCGYKRKFRDNDPTTYSKEAVYVVVTTNSNHSQLN